MKTHSIFAKGLLASLAAATALTAGVSAPSVAAAQSSYYDRNGTYYDPCQRERTNRGVGAGVLGAIAGAVIGSNVAARNARTEGAVLGGVVGAAGGAAIGRSSAACEPGYAPAPRTSYYENDGRYRSSYYGDRYSYDRNRYAPAYRDYAYDERGASFVVTDRPPSADGCTLAESPIYLPDGRVQKRFVRVCQDASGRYQVVD